MNSRSPYMPDNDRLQKVLSRAGVASRRQAERLILEGRVEVNGVIANELGKRVAPRDEIRVDGAIVDPEPMAYYLLLHKPVSCLSTKSDPEGRATIMDLIPDEYHSVFPVGRLDWSSEGLLVLTNDGELANRMTHPRYGLERVYAVKLKGVVKYTDARFKSLLKGVKIGPGQVLRVQRIEAAGRSGKHSWHQFTLTEGKNREIRRLCDAVGLDVLRLKRLAFGPVALAGLKPGEWRELTPHEVQVLKSALGMRKSG
jgi:23S rRNA pseudouridine2605 synthase